MAKQLTLDAACDNVKDGFRVGVSKWHGARCTHRSVETYECEMIRKLKKLQTYCGVMNFETFATAYKIHNNQYGHLHLHKSLPDWNFLTS